MAESISSSSATWPRPFRLRLPKAKEHDGHGLEPKQRWWSHDLYRGPRNQKPKVLYAKSRGEAEEIAEGFRQEKVLGFDMEWPSYDVNNSNEGRLQDKIGVIAIACEDKIALFHLGAYAGKSPSDFIGPVLRAIIESPTIIKAGVNIFAADFRRLEDHFGLQPQGAVELSHLHNLITHGTNGEFNLCTTKLCALGEQVQTHLSLPLKKSSVRTSNWSQRKQLSREQKSYAASDAYAGFMLHHYLSHLRLSMEPKPPPPIYAERYRSIDMPGRGTGLLLQLNGPDDPTSLEVIRAVDFFEGRHEATHQIDIGLQSIQSHAIDLEDPDHPQPASPRQRSSNAPSGPRRSGRPAIHHRTAKTPRKKPNSLLNKLKTHRDRIAKQRRLDIWKIIHNSALELIAKHQPENETALMQLKGVGPQTVKKYGAAILNIVASHVEEQKGLGALNTDGSDSEDPAGDIDRNETISRVERPGDSQEARREPGPENGTSETRAVQQDIVGSGSRSDPIQLSGSADVISSREASSRPAVKRQRTSTSNGPRHGLLRYFRVNKDERREATVAKP